MFYLGSESTVQALSLGGSGSYFQPWLQINPPAYAWQDNSPYLVPALIWANKLCLLTTLLKSTEPHGF